jgi:hypothetical protein
MDVSGVGLDIHTSNHNTSGEDEDSNVLVRARKNWKKEK